MGTESIKNNKSYISSLIQTLTVGFGIAPNQPQKWVADYTAGRELHPAPKNLFI